jgi:hypothetical protein
MIEEDMAENKSDQNWSLSCTGILHISSEIIADLATTMQN